MRNLACRIGEGERVKRRRHTGYLTLALLAVSSIFASTAHAIITVDIRSDTGSNIVINQIVGAERFYEAGYFGGRTLIANVEAGHVWNGHEATSNVSIYVNDPSIDSSTRQFDAHATQVGFTMTGLGPNYPGVGYYYYQLGMAPAATLASVAIASSFGSDGSFDVTPQSFAYGYKTAMQTGVPVEVNIWGITFTYNATADVINSSWGFPDNAGTDNMTRTIDALAYANHQTVCLAAGNHETGSPQVGGPASGYNSIAVGALASDTSTPAYSQPASFSNTSPNDFYNPQTHQTIPNVRPAVDIAAPGQDLILATYTGTTGGNTGGTDSFNGASDIYAFGAGGTSFASPIVAGGAALVVDLGYDRFGGGQAVDGRVVKAILLNSADKTVGWTNNAHWVNGTLLTTQSLDFAVGAGSLNLSRAFDQYTTGTTNLPGDKGGTVHDNGWDYATLSQDTSNEYRLDAPLSAGTHFRATLDWFVNVQYDDATQTPSDGYFAQLDLQLWKVENGQLARLIAAATGNYNNVDLIDFTLPEDGEYALRVVWAGLLYDFLGGTHTEDYALAWSVPEPASLALLLLGASALLLKRKRA